MAANASTTAIRKQVATRLSDFPASEIARAARVTGVTAFVGGKLRGLADTYPDGEQLAAAVLGQDKALDKKEAAVLRARAIVLLAALDPSAALPLATALTKDADKAWMTCAVDSLTQMTSDDALDALLAAADTTSGPSPLSAHAGSALRRAKHPEAGARMLALLKEAADGGDDVLRFRMPLIGAIASQQCVAGRSVIEAILTQTKNPMIADLARAALAGYADRTSLDALAAKLEDPVENVRLAAVEALFRIDAKAAYDRLVPHADRDDVVWQSAVGFLVGNRGYVQADARLCALFERIVEAGTGSQFWTAWHILADLGDLRQDPILSILRKGERRPSNPELASCLFRLQPSALPVIEEEAAGYVQRAAAGDFGKDAETLRAADLGTLRNVVKHLKTKPT